MQTKSVSGIISMVAALLIIVCGAPVSDVFAKDDSDGGGCSNRTLKGNYGFAIEGLILAGGGVTVPLRGVALTNFDGKGNLTQVDHVVAGGTPPPTEWTPGSGPYTVNPDCTGTAQINIPGSPFSPVHLHFVVVRQGKEIHTVVDPNPGQANASTSVGIRVE